MNTNRDQDRDQAAHDKLFVEGLLTILEENRPLRYNGWGSPYWSEDQDFLDRIRRLRARLHGTAEWRNEWAGGSSDHANA